MTGSFAFRPEGPTHRSPGCSALTGHGGLGCSVHRRRGGLKARFNLLFLQTFWSLKLRDVSAGQVADVLDEMIYERPDPETSEHIMWPIKAN